MGARSSRAGLLVALTLALCSGCERCDPPPTDAVPPPSASATESAALPSEDERLKEASRAQNRIRGRWRVETEQMAALARRYEADIAKAKPEERPTLEGARDIDLYMMGPVVTIRSGMIRVEATREQPVSRLYEVVREEPPDVEIRLLGDPQATATLTLSADGDAVTAPGLASLVGGTKWSRIYEH